VVVSLALLLVLGAVSVALLFESLEPPQEAARPGAGPAIRGTVTVAPALRDRIPDDAVLFVIARKTAGHPFAVLRIPAPRFPVRYTLGPEAVMGGEPFAGEVTLSAKLTRAGAPPAEPGVLEGEGPGAVAVGAAGADILLSRAP
jgi:cytochrome c-type biogenesis protein CcmH